jgi:hypothetical protein
MRPSVPGIVVLGVAIGGIILLHGRRPVVTHIAPAGAVRADSIVRFSWHSVPGTVRYTIDVARPDGVPVASAATLGDTTIDVSTLALVRGIAYRWSVTATDRRGRASRSTPVTFSVAR